MPKLTKKFIESKIRRPERGQIIFRDSELRGFALRVTRGSMSYIVECRVNGTNRRITIGPHGPLTPDTARRDARKLLAAMTTGHDPKVEQAKNKIAMITLAEVLEDYLASRTLRPNSVRSFRHVLARCLGDWLSLPVRSITKEMVTSRHRELTKVTRQGTSGMAQANVAMERLGILMNFAANYYEIDGQPIIHSNPVNRLSQIRAWHRIPRRQSLIPDHKLHLWYQAVKSLRNKMLRDYLLILLFTGLRRNEAATLRWTDIDFETKVLTVRVEISKNHREHRLPLSEYVYELLTMRKIQTGDSEWVFPGRRGLTHMKDSTHVITRIGKEIGCRFMLHDLRRGFLTAAEKLEVPHYVLKKLANHVSTRDVTGGYIVVDVERVRSYISKISQHLLLLLGASTDDLREQGTVNRH